MWILLVTTTLLIFPFLLAENLDKPIYQYLKDLCPVGQLPLTGPKTVKTCASICPLGALCYRGICCVQQPQCRHPSFRISTGFACLPNVKNHCPDYSQCVSSSQDGMSICCSTKTLSTKPSKKRIEKSSSVITTVASNSTICPSSHPIIAHDGKNLILCKDCHQGICARFRKSSVEVCCQSSDDICGPGSQVLMDGYVPRDCSKKSCGKGYECSLTPAGVRVCCSMAKCPSGVFARSVCAAGCMKNEKCVPIQDEMWCCPLLPEAKNRELKCSSVGAISSGDRCDPQLPICPSGATCEINQEQSAYICCFREKKIDKHNKKKQPFIPPMIPPTFTTSTQLSISAERETILNCLDGSEALFQNGLSVMCPKLGDPCPKAGFICQLSDLDDVFVCCSSGPSLPVIVSETPQPSCPFSYIPARKETNDELQRCLTLFSLDCPFGYTCLPSSTTDSYLCCMRKPL